MGENTLFQEVSGIFSYSEPNIYILALKPSYFLQAIGNALCATGFGESIAGLLSENEIPNPWIERSVAAFVIVMLTLINLAGVKWVIRLQFLLLGILVLGAMDFGIGSFTHTNEGKIYILLLV